MFSTLLHAQVVTREAQFTARCSRTYANAHTYHINSISMSSDRETFLSADDLRINLWHLDISSCSFNILDIKPAKMEDLTEVLPPLAERLHSYDCPAWFGCRAQRPQAVHKAGF